MYWMRRSRVKVNLNTFMNESIRDSRFIQSYIIPQHTNDLSSNTHNMLLVAQNKYKIGENGEHFSDDDLAI